MSRHVRHVAALREAENLLRWAYEKRVETMRSNREAAAGRRSDSANLPFGFKGAEKDNFVRIRFEITTGARDFQADDEGSIPFTRSNSLMSKI
jgi:hypothetical protein